MQHQGKGKEMRGVSMIRDEGQALTRPHGHGDFGGLGVHQKVRTTGMGHKLLGVPKVGRFAEFEYTSILRNRQESCVFDCFWALNLTHSPFQDGKIWQIWKA
jgi:hypothetical protein